jgi:hypothetical protein
MAAFLIPWLWLVSAYTLKAFEDLIGRELNYGNSNKASP